MAATNGELRKARYARVVKRITSWEKKRRRADNALKKLVRQKQYYERSM